MYPFWQIHVTAWRNPCINFDESSRSSASLCRGPCSDSRYWSGKGTQLSSSAQSRSHWASETSEQWDSGKSSWERDVFLFFCLAKDQASNKQKRNRNSSLTCDVACLFFLQNTVLENEQLWLVILCLKRCRATWKYSQTWNKNSNSDKCSLWTAVETKNQINT